jgi:hypothetical protein
MTESLSRFQFPLIVYSSTYLPTLLLAFILQRTNKLGHHNEMRDRRQVERNRIKQTRTENMREIMDAHDSTPFPMWPETQARPASKATKQGQQARLTINRIEDPIQALNGLCPPKSYHSCLPQFIKQRRKCAGRTIRRTEKENHEPKLPMGAISDERKLE